MTVERILRDFYEYGVIYAQTDEPQTVESLMKAAMKAFDVYCTANSYQNVNLYEFREYAISAFIDGFGNPE